MAGRTAKCVCAKCEQVCEYDPERQLGSLHYCPACYDFMRDYWANRRRE
jgi:NAD-dependent SIR2 family protein deacetylase